MTEEKKPASIEELTAAFKSRMETAVDQEAEIVKKIGFVVKVESGVAYTKELKIAGKPSMIIGFADQRYLHSQYLGESLGIAAGNAQHEGVVRATYDLHVMLDLGLGNEVNRVPLANRLMKVSNEQIIAHIETMGRGLLPQEGMDVYLMQFGDYQNRLPGTEGYEDVGQLAPMTDDGLMAKFFVPKKAPSKKAPSLNNWLTGYKPAVPPGLTSSEPHPDTVQTTVTPEQPQ